MATRLAAESPARGPTRPAFAYYHPVPSVYYDLFLLYLLPTESSRQHRLCILYTPPPPSSAPAPDCQSVQRAVVINFANTAACRRFSRGTDHCTDLGLEWPVYKRRGLPESKLTRGWPTPTGNVEEEELNLPVVPRMKIIIKVFVKRKILSIETILS